jgi:hypothetical protein
MWIRPAHHHHGQRREGRMNRPDTSPHSIMKPAFLNSLQTERHPHKKLGLTVTSEKVEGTRVYRIVP